ncbi:hypothetical protein LWI29_003740 [Acer saccharum]|uniref:Uncharacterized protein n=1 Tax=Acer saccharum TaxID=4024 RepID=A0AA39VSL9_ACESA|nr:hypothetical protein LWI29_003740 [Acer saccharum]KAK1593078.1 hypothetical protein Q3G72_035596 [Acer saccharum]
MKSLRSVGLGLSVVFGCLLLALVAELYYLLWWKKRFTSRDIESDYSNPAREFFYMFCWRRPSSLSHTALNPQEVRITDSLVQEAQQAHHQNHYHHHHQSNNNKDFVFKPFDDDDMETELMRLHNLSGPPRFLFTIIEETKEDLESEDGKSRGDNNKSRKGSRSRSLSDLLLTVETPYMTPLTSPPFLTPPLTPPPPPIMNQHGFNPLSESSTDAEFNKIRSSPPPKFKFLQEAEEKLYRRKLIEEEDGKKSHRTDDGVVKDHEDDGPFITITIDRNNHHHSQLTQYNSSSSQVLPLASSPSTTTFRSSSPAKKRIQSHS